MDHIFTNFSKYLYQSFRVKIVGVEILLHFVPENFDEKQLKDVGPICVGLGCHIENPPKPPKKIALSFHIIAYQWTLFLFSDMFVHVCKVQFHYLAGYVDLPAKQTQR